MGFFDVVHVQRLLVLTCSIRVYQVYQAFLLDICSYGVFG